MPGRQPSRSRLAMTREELFLAELPLIERVIAWVCARRSLRGADAEDFAQTVKTRLIENDYEILGKYQGRSSLKTFLTVVVNRMYLDFQNRRLGKWRPSAAARREGPLAMRLERLIHRDGLTFDEACGELLSDPREPTTREELHALSLRLPWRPSRRPKTSVGEPSHHEDGARELERAERQALANRTFCVIRRWLDALPPPDRLFMRLQFESRFTIAEAARRLGLEQKPLYRRSLDLLAELRKQLEAEGIGVREAQELLETLDWDAAWATGQEDPESPEPCPSQEGGRATERDRTGD